MHTKPAILLIQKHEGEFHRLNSALRCCGVSVHVHWAHNSADARAYLSGEDGYDDRLFFPLPDLILADASITPSDSLQFVAWLRSEHGLNNLPVVLLGLPEAMAPAGADESVPKPCDPDRLAEILAALLVRHCRAGRAVDRSRAQECAA